MAAKMKLKNMNDIRGMMAEEIQRLRDEETTAANLNAVSNATGKILGSIKLEMEYARLCGHKPKSDFIQLGDKVTIEKTTATN